MTSERYDGPIPPLHGEREGPGEMPRCPYCASVVDMRDVHAYCAEHGLVHAIYLDRDEILARAER